MTLMVVYRKTCFCSAESNNRPQNELRLYPPTCKTCGVFRTPDALMDQIDKGADKWRRIPHLPRDNNRHGRRRIALEFLYNDAWWKQRAHRIGQERKSQSFLDETQVAEHIIGA